MVIYTDGLIELAACGEFLWSWKDLISDIYCRKESIFAYFYIPLFFGYFYVPAWEVRRGHLVMESSVRLSVRNSVPLT